MNGLLLCTEDCNLRCKYCFEENMHKDLYLSKLQVQKNFNFFIENYLEKFVDELYQINLQQKKRQNITFHGGEPLLIGEELFEKALKIVSKYKGTDICMQTNGTLFTDKIIDLCKKYKVKVGISIDGPKEIHDVYRLNRGKKGSFDLVYSNIKKLQEKGVIVGGLATVTDVTILNPEKFYNFFKENNLNFSFNPCYIEPNIKSSCSHINLQEYIKFTNKIFDLWINDNSSNISINAFERIMSAMCVKKRIYMEVCSFIPDCSKTTVAINPKGEFYRCLHYCLDKKNMIGNLDNNTLWKAVGDNDMCKRIDYLEKNECKNCDIFEYCYGGCPYIAESLNGNIYSKANTCESQKTIVHHIREYLKQFEK